MALSYGNQYVGSGFVSVFGKTITSNTAYGKLGEQEKLIGLDSLIGGSGGNSKDLENLYNNIGSDLEEILLKYALGKFNEVSDDITQSRLDNIKNELTNQTSTSSNKFFEIYKLTFQRILDTLKNTTTQYIEYLETVQKLEVAQEKADILDSPEQLQNYIDKLNLKQNVFLFDLPDITTTAATIKPEIQEYIKLYGVPENLDFDQNKLTFIKNKLYN
jgi:hypothetical protein